MSEWLDFYCYENNVDLITKLCKKFNISKPNERANAYGGLDVSLTQGLKLYIIEFDECKEEVIIRRRNSLDRGKFSKEYSNPVKKFKDGNIWYDALKFISNDSKL